MRWSRLFGRGGDPAAGQPAAGDAVVREKAFRLTSTAENSTVAWWDQYEYVEDIRDGRGYTGGLVGFTTATSDMLELVERYAGARPTGNPLAPYLPGLRACAEFGETVDQAAYGRDGAGASVAADRHLGPAFLTAWVQAARTDPVFRRCQRDLRDEVYWRPALEAAVADGLGPLGRALYYDTLVNHGPGEAGSGDGSFTDIRSRTPGARPVDGGAEAVWLAAFLGRRSAVLTEWGDNPPDGRVAMFGRLLDSGNLGLTTPFSWSVYGDAFTMATDPDPRGARP
ncbi:chitosanase [Pseudonocardia kujensis]|uniref:chitosanase n=1 Tax=Pseudonocardia kujensis TaxID=1128675 RepID=UPI001E36D03E|nr:chitosanase [Pseudonocardia kujensis]MCE0763439.1 chitosanase [Pseudonocardia kujensis]